MIAAIFQIARNTLRENAREPIFLLLLLVSMVMIGLLPTMTLFVFREQMKMVVDTALATMLLGGWVLAVISASHAIAQEIDSGTAMLMLAKPIDRATFILGKLFGIVAGLLVYCFLTGLSTLVAMRVAKDQFWFDTKGMWTYFGVLALCLGAAGVWNFVKRSSYPMNVLLCLLLCLPLGLVGIRFIPVDGGYAPYAWSVLPALVLVVYAVVAMGILAAALSTRLQLVPNLLICSVVFTVGLMSDYLLGRFAEDNWLAAILYAAVPNWQLMWMADALAADNVEIPLRYVAWGGAYLAMFAGVFVCLAMILFRNREVGRQSLA